MELKAKGSLKFLCGECLQGLLPNILKRMDELKLEIKQLKEIGTLSLVDELKSEIQKLKSQFQPLLRRHQVQTNKSSMISTTEE